MMYNQVFPTEARATCHGFSAAMGKLGAAVGGLILKPLTDHYCPGQDCTTKSPKPTKAETDAVRAGRRAWCTVCAGTGSWVYTFL
jgi:hypothetical protein